MAAVEPFISCDYLRGCLVFGEDRLAPCCHVDASPTIYRNYSGKPLDVERIRAWRLDTEKKLNAGEVCDCTGCAYLEKRVWPESDYFVESTNFIGYNPCNLRCTYCEGAGIAHSDTGVACDKQRAIYGELYRRNLLNPDSRVYLGCGEPLLMPGVDKLLEELLANSRGIIEVASNLTVLPDALPDLVRSDRIRITVSPDAGTPETYRAIKRRDLYHRVVENITRLTEVNPRCVKMKYICLPENANAADRDGFLELARERGVEVVILSFNNREEATEEVAMFAGEMKHLVERMGKQLVFDVKSCDAYYPGTSIREFVNIGHRRAMRRYDYAAIPQVAAKKEPAGFIDRVCAVSFGGTYVTGWAFDQENKRYADEITLFWNSEPIVAGTPIWVREDLPFRGGKTGFYLLVTERYLDELMVNNPWSIAAFARFGDDWRPLIVWEHVTTTD